MHFNGSSSGAGGSGGGGGDKYKRTHRHPVDILAGELFQVALMLAPQSRLRLLKVSNANWLGGCR